MDRRRPKRQVQYLSDIFWNRWLKEYLPTLHERSKWLKPRPSLAIGDLVLIVDEEVHRGKWPLGRVETFLEEKTDLSGQPEFVQTYHWGHNQGGDQVLLSTILNYLNAIVKVAAQLPNQRE